MTTLREAAQQALEACEQRLPLQGQAAIIDELNSLRAALAEPVEPVAYSIGRTLHWHEGNGVSDAQLFSVSPERKPLTDEEIDAEWRKAASEEGFTTAQFVRNFVRAIERAHGII